MSDRLNLYVNTMLRLGVSFLFICIVYGCSGDKNKNISLNFDANQLSGESALLAVIARDGNNDLTVLFHTDFQMPSTLSLNAEIDRTAGARVVVLGFQEQVAGLTPMFAKPGSDDTLTQLIPIDILHSSISTSTGLQTLRTGDPDEDLVNEFASMIHVNTETLIELIPPPTLPFFAYSNSNPQSRQSVRYFPNSFPVKRLMAASTGPLESFLSLDEENQTIVEFLMDGTVVGASDLSSIGTSIVDYGYNAIEGRFLLLVNDPQRIVEVDVNGTVAYRRCSDRATV